MATKPPYAVGAQVEHGKFGPGTVVACTDHQITIKFDANGERKFMLSIAQEHIRKIDRTPPDSKKRSAKKKAAAPAAEAQ